MQIEFEAPEHGWMLVELALADSSRRALVSHIPDDVLTQLICALVRLRAGSTSEEVTWSLEPALWTWRFARHEDEVEVHESISPDLRSSARLPLAKLLRSFTSALTRLESAEIWSAEDRARHWTWEFPSRDLAILREKSG